jgi:peptidoglycan/LPS O-acetylase OafA/YrhL
MVRLVTGAAPAAKASPMRATLAHMPALDGLRGMAVLGVLFFHADALLPGGYLGVDLFFVLSGFLITSLLILEHESTGRVDLAAFWGRRARRLFPALLAIMPAVALYAAFVAPPKELAGLRADALATLAYVANWRSIFTAKSYWDLFAAPSPLEHTWSLAIEEQFYVLWPLVVVGLYRASRRGRRALLVTCLVLGAASAALMALLYDPARVSRVYLGTDTRGAAILAGAALACAKLGRLTSVRVARGLDAFGGVAALGLAIAWARLDGQSAFLYRGGFWLTELACLVLITCAVSAPSNVVARALSVGPLRFFGKISYGVYLWHWPLFVVLTGERTGLHGALLTTLRFAVTLAVALVSFRYLEEPIRRRRLFFARPGVVLASALAATVGLVVLTTRGRARAGEPQVSSGAAPVASALPSDAMVVLVVGDSVAESLGERMIAAQDGARAAVINRGIGDCSLMTGVVPTRSLTNEPHHGGNCGEAWESDVAELHPDVTLIILGGGFFAPVQIGEAWERPCERGWHDAYLAEVTRKLDGLRELGGTRVVVRVPYPVGGWESPPMHGRVDCFNRTLDEAIAASPGVVTMDLATELCSGGACRLEADGARIRPDGMHFQGPGATATARWALTRLRESFDAEGREHAR